MISGYVLDFQIGGMADHASVLGSVAFVVSRGRDAPPYSRCTPIGDCCDSLASAWWLGPSA
jgi:hypothetical protein